MMAVNRNLFCMTRFSSQFIIEILARIEKQNQLKIWDFSIMPGFWDKENYKVPDWWSLNLYEFAEDMPIDGWVWEFMRRSRLLRLGETPVEAMRPNAVDDESNRHFLYYCPWDRRHLAGQRIFTLPPAAFDSKSWPGWFRKRLIQADHFTIENENYEIVKTVTEGWFKKCSVIIDLTRPDKIILRDLNDLLKHLRKEHSIPKVRKPRISNWPDQKILEVWDLRQWKVSWNAIFEYFEWEPSESKARNSYNTAKELINNKGWIDIARTLESDTMLKE